MFMKIIKIISVTILMLVLSQIIGQVPVNGKKLCDYAREAVESRPVTTALGWIANKFDFVNGSINKSRHAGQQQSPGTDSHREISESDRASLSGLLKHH
jgi:hypothetical protein